MRIVSRCEHATHSGGWGFCTDFGTRLRHGMDKVDARAAWKEVMGPGVNTYTTQVELKHDTLYVNLSSAVLREELSMGKSKIIQMLNEALGKELIRNVVLR